MIIRNDYLKLGGIVLATLIAIGIFLYYASKFKIKCSMRKMPKIKKMIDSIKSTLFKIERKEKVRLPKTHSKKSIAAEYKKQIYEK